MLGLCHYLFFFVKQKTAYEMRISDWSSDVCSSDLEGGNAGAARANAFGERALRIELELELSRKIEFGEKLVLADVGRDHLTDLAVVEKRPETEAIGAAIVRDDREILDAACEQAGDQMLGIARKAEAARHERHAAEKDAGKRRLGLRDRKST